MTRIFSLCGNFLFFEVIVAENTKRSLIIFLNEIYKIMLTNNKGGVEEINPNLIADRFFDVDFIEGWLFFLAAVGSDEIMFSLFYHNFIISYMMAYQKITSMISPLSNISINGNIFSLMFFNVGEIAYAFKTEPEYHFTLALRILTSIVTVLPCWNPGFKILFDPSSI